MRKVLLILLAIVAMGFLTQRVNAEVLIDGCTLKRPLGQNTPGSMINLLVPHTGNFDVLRWAEEFCVSGWVGLLVIKGDVNEQMEGAVRNIYESFRKSERFSEMKKYYEVVTFFLESNGGDVERAIRIGRMLRELNASIHISQRSSCISACVFILAGGVERNVYGTVGIHRPYFAALDRRSSAQDVAREITRIDSLISNFLREMNVPLGLLDSMKGVAPSEVRMLTGGALQSSGLNSPDPVFDELQTARDAWRYGTNSAELRRRRVIAERCYSRSSSGGRSCYDAAMYGLSEREYQRRKNRAQEICSALNLEALRQRRASGLTQIELTEAEMENITKCYQDIMSGLR